ncbi:uncharacterized protein LOC113205760 [Frankliniella occidentalis]|uniref:Uncharacterized protein LOC113205760 n=1 Tax=Frankliniella occidentalis TaxID=133901 RepID=A0A6J1S7X5_FRAOC|nr:uncharacterized protein LOC113205760 [Frankliniella occidentalis]XP_052121311.1 uncharacterized protein LOC113205760 [Frankliniella occidentalis]
MDLECDICTERFDGAERLPKVLPCGHTACLQCLGRLPDSSCPTCRRDFNGPAEGLTTNFLALRLLEEVRLDSTPRGWCSDCRTDPSPRCWKDHDVLPVKRALRRQLQGALPQAAEQLQGLQDQCRDEQALPALTLLTGESWDVTLRGGGRELTGTLRNPEEPLTKALCLLLTTRAELTEDRDGYEARKMVAPCDELQDEPPCEALPTQPSAPPAPSGPSDDAAARGRGPRPGPSQAVPRDWRRLLYGNSSSMPGAGESDREYAQRAYIAIVFLVVWCIVATVSAWAFWTFFCSPCTC